MRRVVVSGMGAISGCGADVAALWSRGLEGRSAVAPVRFESFARQQVNHAVPIAAADMDKVWTTASPKFHDRVTALALWAAREALSQAGLAGTGLGDRCGVVIGSGYGGADTIDRNARAFERDPAARLDPFSVPKIMANAPASWISMEYGARGPTLCISTACSSAAQSIGLAATMIRQGLVDRCIAGGTEALLVPTAFRAWEIMRVMTAGLCRPFSAGRDGMVLGEGAGILVLEAEEAAAERGCAPLAEIAGYATNSDAGDLLRPNPESAARCIEAALADAGLAPGDIGYVNAHGTGTVANDLSEGAALRAVFGDGLADLAVSSTKPVHGHALGAAGALECIVSVMALRERLAPPTINFVTMDPKIGIDPVSGSARAFAGDACLSNSFAFGGINACLVLKRYQPSR